MHLLSSSLIGLPVILVLAVVGVASSSSNNDVQPTLRSNDGDGVLEVRLEIGVAPYDNGYLKQNLVGYNGVVGGPTLYVKPGDRLKVTLVNNLPPEPVNTYVPELFNSYHAVDITNLHFHGLHISERENPSGLEVRVGEEYVYDITIPEDHMGGTHWYHPHFPGSTTLQAGGGALGMLIVEDLPGDIPPEIRNLPDLNLRVQFLNMTYLQQDYATGTPGSYVNLCNQSGVQKVDPTQPPQQCHEFFFEDGPLQGTYNTTIAPDGLEYETTLVNGMEQPIIEIEQNQWYRTRILYVPTRFRTLEPAFSTPNCEVKLLAKDGVYMLETPRDVASGFLTSGSRVDFLLRCTELGMAEFRSLSLARNSSNWIASQKLNSLDRLLAHLKVVPPETTTTTAAAAATATTTVSNPDLIPVFKPNRPCYLADMRNIEADALDYLLLSGLLPNGEGLADELPIYRPPCCTNTSYYDVNGLGPLNEQHRGVDGTTPDNQEFDFTLFNGMIWEVDLYVPQIHPAHYHVGVMQLIELPALGVAHADYFQEGDFHDVLQTTITDYYGKAKVRLSIGGPTTRMIGHCHFYRHTDRGMAYLGQVIGEEGAYSPKLKEGPCYKEGESRGRFELVGGPTVDPLANVTPLPRPTAVPDDGGDDTTSSPPVDSSTETEPTTTTTTTMTEEEEEEEGTPDTTPDEESPTEEEENTGTDPDLDEMPSDLSSSSVGVKPTLTVGVLVALSWSVLHW